MRLRTLAALAAVAIALTCASAAVQRTGARRMVEGEAWCGTPAPCAIRALGAGFPLPYLIDDPQVSVPNQIGPLEDDLRPGAFVLDALFYFVAGILLLQPMKRLGLRRSQRSQRSQRRQG